MNISQKCQYALRAVFELAKYWNQEPIRIADIARAQNIPVRFLEVILNELKHAGFVSSRRGAQGGYILSIAPVHLTAGEIIRFVDGPLEPVRCTNDEKHEDCPFKNQCVFDKMWNLAGQAVKEVYDSFTFQDFLDKDTYIPDYCI